MANILSENEVFKERKKLEDIFLEYKPYSLEDALLLINVVEEKEEINELDDETITIDLKMKNTEKKEDIAIMLGESVIDDC